MGKTLSSRTLLIVLAAGLVLAAAVIAYLWRDNAKLQRQAQIGTGVQEPAVRRVRAGDQLPDFNARDTEGREVHVSLRGDRTTLLFIYSPSCDRCEVSMPAWTKVTDKLKQLRASVQVFGLSIADSYTTVQHARTVKLPFPIVPFPNVELQKKYGATEVPLTVVVDSQGVVREVWDKPLEEGDVGDVIEIVCPDCPERAGL